MKQQRKTSTTMGVALMDRFALMTKSFLQIIIIIKAFSLPREGMKEVEMEIQVTSFQQLQRLRFSDIKFT
jgi:hypothetical protein